jgi:hypothetical protein
MVDAIRSNVHWEKSYVELAAAGKPGIYHAVVRDHHWPGCVIFQAQPNSGDHCIEFIGQDKDHVVALAEEWLAGKTPDGFYSAAY